MCDEVKRYGDERADRAKAEEQVKLVASVMKNTNSSLEQALQMAGVAMEDYIANLTLLSSLKSA